MKCAVCGGQLQPVHSDLPFKVSEQTIVILKHLAVWQCENCV
jgi:YgiT-type zinc finger domain-containing protein